MKWLLLIALCGCATVPPPPPPPIPPGTPSCETACLRLEQLHCSAALATPGGSPCAVVCQNIEDSGTVTYGVECVTKALSCAEADQCGGPVIGGSP